ncbi:Protein of unknown function, partial [Gryllus bimaculatus]
NENLFYDKKRSSPKKTLLSRSNGESGEQQAMVQPPLYDVYLCDNCDEEFNTLKEVQEHEKCCCTNQRQPSPPRVTEESSKDSFLNYFNLFNAKGKNLTKNVDHPLRKRGFRNSFWYSSIPISSPLGMLVYKKTRASATTALVQLERLERHCPAKPSIVNDDNRDRGSTLWPVSWKPRKKTDDDWVHVYRKPGRQWRGRTRTSVQSRLGNKKQNLLSQCQNLQVYVRKLTPSEIAYYTNNSSGAKRASISSVVEPKCNTPLVSRQSTNSVHLPSQKVTSSIIENNHSRKQKVEVLTSVNKQSTTNGKRVNSSLGNGASLSRKETRSELEANITTKCVDVSGSDSGITSEFGYILGERHSQFLPQTEDKKLGIDHIAWRL